MFVQVLYFKVVAAQGRSCGTRDENKYSVGMICKRSVSVMSEPTFRKVLG